MSLFTAGVFFIGFLVVIIAILIMRKFLKVVEKEDKDIQNLNS
tara:strand:- start:518 stop:646 length:129 start_codon:yes stop_codon:yes gene_type:complete